MAHFVKIENNIVVDGIVAEQEYINTLDGEWIQTSYNTINNTHRLGGTPLRGNYAGIGFTYDRTNDVFIPPKPYESWILDEELWMWKSPVDKPNDGKLYHWDEETQTWLE